MVCQILSKHRQFFCHISCQDCETLIRLKFPLRSPMLVLLLLFSSPFFPSVLVLCLHQRRTTSFLCPRETSQWDRQTSQSSPLLDHPSVSRKKQNTHTHKHTDRERDTVSRRLCFVLPGGLLDFTCLKLQRVQSGIETDAQTSVPTRTLQLFFSMNSPLSQPSFQENSKSKRRKQHACTRPHTTTTSNICLLVHVGMQTHTCIIHENKHTPIQCS